MEPATPEPPVAEVLMLLAVTLAPLEERRMLPPEVPVASIAPWKVTLPDAKPLKLLPLVVTAPLTVNVPAVAASTTESVMSTVKLS